MSERSAFLPLNHACVSDMNGFISEMSAIIKEMNATMKLNQAHFARDNRMIARDDNRFDEKNGCFRAPPHTIGRKQHDFRREDCAVALKLCSSGLGDWMVRATECCFHGNQRCFAVYRALLPQSCAGT